MTVKIYIDPRSPGFAALERLVEAVNDTPGLLKNLGETFVPLAKKRFDTQTGPDGTPWKPLQPLTVELRGSSVPILTREGTLRNSINYQVVGNTLRVGPNTIYAAAQQFGVTIKPVKAKVLAIPARPGVSGAKKTSRGWFVFRVQVTLPPRPYIGAGPEEERAAAETIEDWLTLG